MAGIEIEFDVPTPMRDGVKLRSDIYRPVGEGPWPVLLSRQPYGKAIMAMIEIIEPVEFAKRGFIVVVQECRGRFGSEGEWQPWTFEEADGYDSVRWAAALEGSNGCVGMLGASYLGNTQWMAALSKPQELKAIAPFLTWSEPTDGLMSRGGAIELGISANWALFMGIEVLTRRFQDDPDKLGAAIGGIIDEWDNLATRGYWELPSGKLPAIARYDVPEIGYERSLRESGYPDACRVAGRHDGLALPTMNIGGWYDIFTQGTLDNYQAMRANGTPATLIVGPWSHLRRYQESFLGEVNFGLTASSDVVNFGGRLIDREIAWFDRWLRPESDDSVASDDVVGAPVLIFVMGINQWREEPDWPLARARDTDFYLRAHGRLSRKIPTDAEQPDEFEYDPANPVMTHGGNLLMTAEFRPGPLDQLVTEKRSDVLVFTSEPLEEDLEVTGRIGVSLFASTDAPSTDWVARLCDVDEKGKSLNVVDGISRVVSEPGEVAEHNIDLWSTSIVFLAGHRIRVQITSSNFPRWDRNLNTGEPSHTETTMRTAHQRIHHDRSRPSKILLPVVPATDRA